MFGRGDRAVVDAMIETLRHRGPDGTGHAVVGRVALLHNRLAIINLVVTGIVKVLIS